MKRNVDPDKPLLTRAEVANIFQVSPSTITRWAEAGKLPMVKTLGGHRRYEVGAIMELAQRISGIDRRATETESNQETSMANTVINIPAMYGDHHVLAVRSLLLEMTGVNDVYASSCFQTVEVGYDPTKLTVDEITARLDDAGYMEALAIPAETGIAVSQGVNGDMETFFRHTTAYEQTQNVVSFAQNVPPTRRVLWPCPGLGVIKETDLEQEASHG